MKKRQQNLSFRMTRWIGSSQSVFLHTVFFIAIFSLRFLGFSLDDILLILTTLVSLEAIYLAIFIQMTINQHGEDLEEVSEDIEEIQKDVDEIQEDVEEITEDVGELQEDVEEISEDVGELQEDVEEINEEEELDQESKFEYIEHTLESLLKEIQELKQKGSHHHHLESKYTK